jgi:preprotein translocase subunit SecA
MLKNLVSAVFGTRHDREVKRLQPAVVEINEHYERLRSLPEAELKSQTERFRQIIREALAEVEAELQELRAERRASEVAAEREELSERIGGVERRQKEVLEGVLDEILPEAFATVKAAAERLVGTEVSVTGQTLTWDMVPYDVQLIGGIALHRGRVAEMATGEGKTLVATLPLYLNALAGRGAHLVTVNSYLAQRDSEWMGHVYRYLGLTVGCIDLHEPGTPERREAYLADITYGTNNEYGFDYLRDNMVHSLEQRVQRVHHYAIIDEVDSVLIDEARTPLIISGPVGSETNAAYARYNPVVADLYRRQARLVNELIAAAEKDVEAGDPSPRARSCSPRGWDRRKNKRLLKLLADDPACRRCRRWSALHDGEARPRAGGGPPLRDGREGAQRPPDRQGAGVLAPDEPRGVHHPRHQRGGAPGGGGPDLTARREARREGGAGARVRREEREDPRHPPAPEGVHALQRDEQYVVQDGQIMIVDEFTGRMMAGRRWSDGLHQAVEAKENVQVKGETQTLATITIQNYFRMYDKLGGMTGTAETEEGEFHQIYNLDVMVIPTNRPIAREDRHDLVYKTKREKYNAIIEEIRRLHAMELPVLVGTVNVDVSETLSRMLKRSGIPHEVLNAKYHGREAQIVATAGQPGGVTIATNMAGRGTDIKLGAGVKERAPSPGAASTASTSPRSRRATRRCRPTWRGGRTTSWWRWAACTSSARSATSRGASTGSSAAAPAARAIPARRSSSCRWRTT